MKGLLTLMILATAALSAQQRHPHVMGGGQRSGGFYAAPMFLFAPSSQAISSGSESHAILVHRSSEDDPIYIPSYMRPSDGPSLAEQAAALKTAHKPAVYIWSNQGTVGTPVP